LRNHAVEHKIIEHVMSTECKLLSVKQNFSIVNKVDADYNVSCKKFAGKFDVYMTT